MDKTVQAIQTGGHAYVLFGAREEVASIVREFIAKTYNLHKGDADYIEYTADNFGIDEVRELTGRVYQKNISLKSTVIISARSITTEAQNALLKTIEEPQTDTIFYIIMPPGAYVLETIKSRAVLVDTGVTADIKFSYKTYIAKPFPERIKYIDSVAKNEEDAYDKEKVAAVIQIVLEGLHQAGDYAVSKDIQDVTKYIYDQSASVKHITEYMSLMVPYKQ